MKHLLDNPAWNALITGDKHLAFGTDKAKYYSPEVSPFVGIAEHNPENFAALFEVIPYPNAVGFFTDQPELNPYPWHIKTRIDGFQMEYQLPLNNQPDVKNIRILEDQHIPEMLALTELTKPGPFLSRTLDFGNYEGIFEDTKLIAMAGQRFHAGPNTEISVVCTHPNFTCKGYGRKLILSQIYQIQARGGNAFLHVREDNTRAIQLYQAMGFTIRKPMFIYILEKNQTL